MDIKILVTAHKKYWMPTDPVYLPLQVGAEGKPDLGYTKDNTGDNISSKNPHYCELTGIYWAWKNLQADYIGLCHYRRYFTKPGFFMRSPQNKRRSILTSADWEQLVRKNDIIVPDKRCYYIETIKQQHCHAHNPKDFALCEKLVRKKYPSFAMAWDIVMARTWGHKFNMLVMQHRYYDEYCSFIFDILFTLEKQIDISQYDANEARVFGYLGELLLDVWLEAKHYPYAEQNVDFMEDQNWLVKGTGFLKRKFKDRRINIPTEQPIRVLQILGIVAGGGVEAVITNYYEHIDVNRVQFDFVVHNDNPVDITAAVEARGGKVYKVTPYMKNIFAFTKEIYQIINQEHYTIVHANMNTLSVFSLLAAWLAGAKIRILHNHSSSVPSETGRNIMKVILRPLAKLFANRYFACSRSAAIWMYGEKCVDAGKVTLINNAVDLAKYRFNIEKREKLRRQLGLTDRFVIGHVGRFVYPKNHQFLINIFYEVQKLNPQARLVLIGNGPLRPVIEAQVRKLHIGDKVTFLGLRSDVQDLYNALDLFVLPSYYEGLPVVGVEAQANGLPMMVSDRVTHELCLTDIIQFKRLEDGAESWAESINKYSLNGTVLSRKDTFNLMTKSGYNIRQAAAFLEDLYFQCIKDEYSEG